MYQILKRLAEMLLGGRGSLDRLTSAIIGGDEN
nr:MAG TPA: hypothetical protein [Caudoviricetes sp.]